MKQSIKEIVLRAARTLYLFAAVASLVIVVGGLIVALFFQMGTWRGASEIPLPSDYRSSPQSLSADNIGKLLVPPQNIRFVPLMPSIRNPLRDRSIGHFTADTFNGLASYPADFDILGGRDAALFVRVRDHLKTKRTGLKPSKALISKVNALLPTLRKPETATYELRIIARDKLGNRSKPETISFSLTYAPPLPAKPKTGSPAIVPEKSVAKLTELQHLAKDIALLVDPKKTPAYFDAYRRAQAIPKECGTSADDAAFVSNF